MERIKSVTPEPIIPKGYELVQCTLRRVCDGTLHTYPFRSISDNPTLAVPMAASPSDLQMNQDDQSSQARTNCGPLPPTQAYNLPIRGKHRNPTQSSNSTQRVSAKTQERYANSRADGYTVVCGVESSEIVPPVKRVNPGNGKFRCPRCKSNFTREKSVKDHFPDCISKHGNPEGLFFTDHPSMKQEEARILNANRTSGLVSSLDDVREDEEMHDAQ